VVVVPLREDPSCLIDVEWRRVDGARQRRLRPRTREPDDPEVDLVRIGTDLLVLVGTNLANNQPVATKYIYMAKKAGTKVIVVNPYVEEGLERYWVPSSPESALFGTSLMDEHFPVSIGGDAAFFDGALKHLLETDRLDHDFVREHTAGLDAVVLDVDGVLVAEKGQMAVQISRYDYPQWALNSVHLDPITAEDLRIPYRGEAATVRVMRVVPGMVHTEEEEMTLKPVDGELKADAGRDLAKIAVFYRHKKEVPETARQGFGFVTGTNFKEDVAFASTVAHDSHNLMVLGTSDAAMVKAANTLIETNGGMAVVVGDEVTVVPLPLAGLMSLERAEVVTEQLHTLDRALQEAGSEHPDLEMTLSLLPLIVLVELHVGNRGLVELKPGQPPQLVDLVVS
jgi:hypothetical protein